MKKTTRLELTLLRQQITYARARGLQLILIRPKKGQGRHRTSCHTTTRTSGRSRNIARLPAVSGRPLTAQQRKMLTLIWRLQPDLLLPVLRQIFSGLRGHRGHTSPVRIRPADWKTDLEQFLASRPKPSQSLGPTVIAVPQPITLEGLDLI